MPARQLAETSLNFSAAAASAVHDAAARSGLDPGDARLIRLFGTAVYHLPAARAVARVALVIPGTVTRLATSVQITRWLAEIGFPAVEPLPVGQPVTSNGCAVTFWHYLPQEGAEPAPADLGRLLRQLHQLDPPPVFVPAYRPLVSVRPAIDTSQAIGEEDRAWLHNRCSQLLAAYDELSFPLRAGMPRRSLLNRGNCPARTPGAAPKTLNRTG